MNDCQRDKECDMQKTSMQGSPDTPTPWNLDTLLTQPDGDYWLLVYRMRSYAWYSIRSSSWNTRLFDVLLKGITISWQKYQLINGMI